MANHEKEQLRKEFREAFDKEMNSGNFTNMFDWSSNWWLSHLPPNTLAEKIEKCGDKIAGMRNSGNGWVAYGHNSEMSFGRSPSEALDNLYEQLHENRN